MIYDVRTLSELWALLQKKVDSVGDPLVPVPLEEQYLTDSWSHPYLLQIVHSEKEMVIRISSKGGGEEIFDEMVFTKGAEKKVIVVHSWDPNHVNMKRKHLQD